MNKLLRCLLSFLIASTSPIALAGPAVIWNGSNAKMLPQASMLTFQGHNITYNGDVNYIQNQGAEGDGIGSTPAQWTTYNDAAGTAPVDCTGGSPSITWTANATTPLLNLQDFNFTKGASNRQGDGVAAAFTVSGADTNKMLALSFMVKSTSANYVASDMSVWVYDVTNSQLITPPNNTIPQGFTGTFSTSFVTSSSTSYRLCVHQASTNANSYNVYFDNFYVGPGSQVQGAAVSYLGSLSGLSVSGNGSKVFTIANRAWRIGSNLALEFSLSGNATASGSSANTNFSINLPAGYTIDQTALPSGGFGSGADTLGFVQTYGITAASQYDYSVKAFPTTTSSIVFLKPNVSPTAYTIADLNVARAMEVGGYVTIPIAEWAGNGTVNLGPLNGCEYATNSSTSTTTSDTTSFAYNFNQPIQSITADLSRRVRFRYGYQFGDQYGIMVSANGSQWVDLLALSSGVPAGGAAGISSYMRQTSTFYGIQKPMPITANTTDFDIAFGAYAISNSTYAAAGQEWSAGAGAYYWTAWHCTQGAAVGFGLATTTQSGLVSTTTQSFAGAKQFTSGGYYGNVPTVYSATQSIPNSTSFSSPSSQTQITIDSNVVTNAAWAGGGSTVSTGTGTYTIGRIGYYRVDVINNTSAANTTTSKAVRVTYGGTASLLTLASVDQAIEGSTVSDLGEVASGFFQVTAVGQTITVNPIARASFTPGTVNQAVRIVITPL